MEIGVVFEVCLGLNVFLNVLGDWLDYLIKKLCDVGVKVIVLIDDLFFFYIIMICEYEMLFKIFGWDEDDFFDLNKIVIEVVYCD